MDDFEKEKREKEESRMTHLNGGLFVLRNKKYCRRNRGDDEERKKDVKKVEEK